MLPRAGVCRRPDDRGVSDRPRAAAPLRPGPPRRRRSLAAAGGTLNRAKKRRAAHVSKRSFAFTAYLRARLGQLLLTCLAPDAKSLASRFGLALAASAVSRASLASAAPPVNRSSAARPVDRSWAASRGAPISAAWPAGFAAARRRDRARGR